MQAAVSLTDKDLIAAIDFYQESQSDLDMSRARVVFEALAHWVQMPTHEQERAIRVNRYTHRQMGRPVLGSENEDKR